MNRRSSLKALLGGLVAAPSAIEAASKGASVMNSQAISSSPVGWSASPADDGSWRAARNLADRLFSITHGQMDAPTVHHLPAKYASMKSWSASFKEAEAMKDRNALRTLSEEINQAMNRLEGPERLVALYALAKRMGVDMPAADAIQKEGGK